MKTLTILFESPNVFYAVINGVNIRIEKGIEEVKYACYQSDQRITGPCNLLFWEESILKPGDIFQVEGFEYEVNNCNCVVEQYQGNCQYPLCKRAILKLAKEEEFIKREKEILEPIIKIPIVPSNDTAAKEEEPKCRCSNDLEYSNCSTKCERYSAELEEESFFIKTYNQAIDDVQSKFNILLSLDPKDISYRNLLKIAENLKTIIEEIEKLKK